MSVTGIITTKNYIANVKELENLARSYNGNLSVRERANLIVGFGRNPYYKGLKWCITAGVPDKNFIEYVKNKSYNLYSMFYENGGGLLYAKDPSGNLIDVIHMFATLDGYISSSIIKKEWSGWAGDLGSASKDIQTKSDNCKDFDKLVKLSENYIFSNNGEFPMSDFTADLDAEYIAKLICNGMSISAAFDQYYTSQVSNRVGLFISEHGGNNYKLDNYIFTIMNNADLYAALSVTYNYTLIPINNDQIYAITGTFVSKLRRLL